MKNNKFAFLILFVITVMIAAPFVIKKLTAANTQISSNSADTSATTSVISANSQSKNLSTASIPSAASQPVSSAFTNNGTAFFNDALFIGDSRMVGLAEYGKIQGATYFAHTGMSVYKIFKTDVSVADVGKLQLEELLSRKTYGKIYLMLGINELGYNFDNTIKKFGEMIQTIHRLNPNAAIYILSNLHVTQSRSDSDKIFTNANIDRFNQAIADLADNRAVFYLDMNPLYDDSNGNMDEKYSGDGIHLRAKYYAEWGPWLQNKTN